MRPFSVSLPGFFIHLFLFYLEDYNIITTFFPSSFFSLNLIVGPSLFSFKFTASYFTNCYCMHVCIYMHIFLSIACLINIMLLEGMSSGLTVWYWTTNLVCSSLGKIITPIPSFPQLSSPLCRVKGVVVAYIPWP